MELVKRPRSQAYEPGTVWTVAQLRAFLATAKRDPHRRGAAAEIFARAVKAA